MQFSREAYIELMTFGRIERQMFVELFGPIVGLEQEWQEQGAGQDELDLTAFDWDYVATVNCGGNTGLRGGLEPKIIKKTADYIIRRDELGRTTKLVTSSATIPLPMDFPVKNIDDWQELKHLYLFHEDRIDWSAVDHAKQQQSDGALVVAYIPGAFDTARELMGAEHACLCYFEQPELMFDILNTLKDTSLKVLERVTDKLSIDQLSVHEDLAGHSGPMIGPAQIQEFVQPYFLAVWELLWSRGTKIFDMDTDGNVDSVLTPFIECGLNSMHPFEPAAGMDVVKIRRQYGSRLAMRGGIDKHVLRKSKAEIREELEYKMQPLMREGGIAFGLDHRIPNGTPLENYRYYVDSGREMLGLPPRDADTKGWRRMAF